MTVDRLHLQTPDTEASMSIHFTAPNPTHTTSDSATASAAPTDSTTTTSQPSDYDPTERVETIDMKHRTNSEILSELVRVTGAYPIEPTAEEREEMRMLEEQRDAKESAEVRARARRERELLEQARGDLASQPA